MPPSHFSAAFAVLAVALLGAPAEAQWREAGDTTARHQGYRDGARAGGDDAREGRPYEYQRHRAYRGAESGHRPRDGRRDDYKQAYRAGFVAGYRDGYASAGGDWSTPGPPPSALSNRGRPRGAGREPGSGRRHRGRSSAWWRR